MLIIALRILGVLIVMIFVTALWVRTNFQPISIDEKVKRALKLIDSVGGADKIYGEARQIFSRFGTSSDRLLSKQDLEDFPIIASMGMNKMIHLGFSYHPGYPGYPGYLSIRTAGHFEGYKIDIIDTTNGQCLTASVNRIELIKCIIFVE